MKARFLLWAVCSVSIPTLCSAAGRTGEAGGLSAPAERLIAQAEPSFDLSDRKEWTRLALHVGYGLGSAIVYVNTGDLDKTVEQLTKVKALLDLLEAAAKKDKELKNLHKCLLSKHHWINTQLAKKKGPKLDVLAKGVPKAFENMFKGLTQKKRPEQFHFFLGNVMAQCRLVPDVVISGKKNNVKLIATLTKSLPDKPAAQALGKVIKSLEAGKKDEMVARCGAVVELFGLGAEATPAQAVAPAAEIEPASVNPEVEGDLGSDWQLVGGGPGSMLIMVKTKYDLWIRREGTGGKLGFAGLVLKLPKKVTVKSKFNNTVYLDLNVGIHEQGLTAPAKIGEFFAYPVHIYLLDKDKKVVADYGYTTGAIPLSEKKKAEKIKKGERKWDNFRIELGGAAEYLKVVAEGHDFEVQVDTLRLQGYLDDGKKEQWVNFFWEGEAAEIK
ncbi:MAG: hypothetical protein JXR96_02805 [Deltaproteobacteria bacterium]|nr:hypothetical protein [Deltaproteobacteria bacterium]